MEIVADVLEEKQESRVQRRNMSNLRHSRVAKSNVEQ